MRIRRPALPAGIAVTAILAGTAAAVMTGGGRAGPSGPTTAPPPAKTAAIERGDLTDSMSVDGTLTYEGERKIYGGAAGTVTSIAPEGAIVTRGRPLIKVDRKPQVLMYGWLPLYRTLQRGVSDGTDVEQLERNLKKLGYGDDMTVDTEFTYATYLAVLDWQDDRGLPETGAVDASQVVFLPGPARVSAVKAEVGDKVAPGHQVLTVTSTRRTVHVDLEADLQPLARKGARVTVELPDGTELKGKISEIGTVVDAGSDAPGDESEPTVGLEIALASPKKAGRLDQAPVSVTLTSEKAKGVLSVPIEALLALREGGFGVELVDGGTSKVVAVETGAYGQGRVEVSGAGLAEGMKVGVPDR
ncbi:peptidoglycan-binding protein [Sphaerisporangium aureirubrum]|uniref:Peptidoglycan-binding protein n=1 Tax=Sphaerisporangium aureirubrum TaxID=1544736 RepID=A0ABW1NRZ7_9ACTN